MGNRRCADPSNFVTDRDVFETILGARSRTYIFSHTTNRIECRGSVAGCSGHLLALPIGYFQAKACVGEFGSRVLFANWKNIRKLSSLGSALGRLNHRSLLHICIYRGDVFLFEACLSLDRPSPFVSFYNPRYRRLRHRFSATRL